MLNSSMDIDPAPNANVSLTLPSSFVQQPQQNGLPPPHQPQPQLQLQGRQHRQQQLNFFQPTPPVPLYSTSVAAGDQDQLILASLIQQLQLLSTQTGQRVPQAQGTLRQQQSQQASVLPQPNASLQSPQSHETLLPPFLQPQQQRQEGQASSGGVVANRSVYQSTLASRNIVQGQGATANTSANTSASALAPRIAAPQGVPSVPSPARLYQNWQSDQQQRPPRRRTRRRQRRQQQPQQQQQVLRQVRTHAHPYSRLNYHQQTQHVQSSSQRTIRHTISITYQTLEQPMQQNQQSFSTIQRHLSPFGSFNANLGSGSGYLDL